MTGQIAIIGLGQIGASVGMALKKAESPLTRVGFDKDIAVLNGAEAVGAVDQTRRRLPDAIRDADIVLLALPLGEIPDLLPFLTPYLKEGAIVMETSPVKKGLVTKLQQAIPEGRYFVGLVPAINVEALTDPETGLKAARPDLFKRTVMMIAVPHGAPEEVEQLAINFVRLLGAKPLLADLAEADGLMAVAHILPQIAAAALLQATIDRPGWSDSRKLASRPFVGVTGGMAYYDDPVSLGAAVLSNPQAALHALDEFIAILEELRDEIDRADAGAVGKRLKAAFDSRERWLNERSAAEWLSEGGEPAELPNVGEQVMQILFGNRIIDRNKRKKEVKKK